jgi:hypothetical protein
MPFDNAPPASPTNQSTTCTLYLEDFKDVMSNSAYVDENWKCRKCQLLAADHPRGQQGNNIDLKKQNFASFPHHISSCDSSFHTTHYSSLLPSFLPSFPCDFIFRFSLVILFQHFLFLFFLFLFLKAAAQGESKLLFLPF